MATVLLVNGPNLNLLGTREPEIYGHTTLEQVEGRVREIVGAAGHECLHTQSNTEGVLVDWLQAHRDADFLILNPAGLTNFSVPLRDAVTLTRMPFIELHLSNIHAREAFRHHSLFSGIATGIIMGLGAVGYELAARFAVDHLERGGRP